MALDAPFFIGCEEGHTRSSKIYPGPTTDITHQVLDKANR
jgi:hypothetical protein